MAFFTSRQHFFNSKLLLTLLLIISYFSCQARASHNPGQQGIDSLRRHPFLLTTPARVAQLRHAIRADAWQAQNWQRLKSQADELLGQPVILPPRAGNWEHYYVDTTSGILLRRGRQLADWQWEHQNPRTGQLYRSRPGVPSQDYDGVVLGTIHDAWALGVVQLGLAYQLSGDARYARKARQILLAYADLYPKLPVVNRSRGRNPKDLDFGKAHVQPLEEATWLIDLVQGADLVWPVLSKRDQQILKKQLFAPAANLVDQSIQPTPNIVCWENAAIGMAGLLTQDQLLLDRAFNHPTKGFQFQVAKNIRSDGFWVEQTPAYHLYALQALITLGQAAANAGYPADLTPLKKMLDAPLQLADAALVLPAFNDSHRTHLLLHPYLYEWGYARFHDAAYLEVLRQSARGKTASRGTSFLDWALLYGEQALPATAPRPLASRNFPASGLGRLVKGPEDSSTVLCLKYTPYVNGHSHRDQLSFVLQKGNEQIAVDPGVNVYGDPAHWLWYQNSAAHNTFMLNQLAQRPSTTQCLAFGQSAGSDYLMVETRNAYDSVRFVRTAALLTENLVLFIDQAQVRRTAHNLTVAYHQNGHWISRPASVPYDNPKTGAGFALLNNRQIAPQQRGISLLGQLPSGRRVRVTTDASSPMSVITANDPAVTNGEVSSVFFQRPTAANTVFIWCITLDGQPVAIQAKEPVASDAKTRKIPALQLRIRTARGQQWKISVNPDKQTAPNSSEPSIFQVEQMR